MARSLLKLSDLTRDEIDWLLVEAARLKRERKEGGASPDR